MVLPSDCICKSSMITKRDYFPIPYLAGFWCYLRCTINVFCDEYVHLSVCQSVCLPVHLVYTYSDSTFRRIVTGFGVGGF
jgi:hypothetical protein